MVDEGLLHRMQRPVRLGETLDRRDVTAFGRGGKREAGQHTPAVDDHGACAALAVVAALLGACQPEVLAQRVEQRGADIECNEMLVAVDPQREADRRAGVPGVLGANGLCRSDARNRRQGRR
jgi:hypothetical protein